MWLLAWGFADRIRLWWPSYHVEGSPSFMFATKLKMLKGDLQQWNANVFGHVVVQKQTYMAGLKELGPLYVEEKGRRELCPLILKSSC